jgi:rhamnose transport system permease protein
MARVFDRLRGWEGLLLLILLVIVVANAVLSPFYLGIGNQINLFQLSIEKIIVALVMTAIIINGEIDLSVASVMGLAACLLAALHERGVALPVAILAALTAGVLAGAFNGFWVAYAGLPSLAVTLAGLIGYRGLARVLLEDRSIGEFPAWFNALGQRPLLGPFPLALLIFALLLILAIVVLQRSGFGRYIYVIGNNREVARYSAVRVRRVKMLLFSASGLVAALAGLLLAARLGAVRGNTAEGFELDIITMVLLGGVSIFGGSGTLTGVLLSILIILNLRNGMSLMNITANTQTGVIGALLILSVLVPNWMRDARGVWVSRARKEAASEGKLRSES